jgi:hypothetical protein
MTAELTKASPVSGNIEVDESHGKSWKRLTGANRRRKSLCLRGPLYYCVECVIQ